jgi:transposase
VRSLAARVAALIRVDAVWLATEPIDMRAGTETALARVVKVFGAAHPHHAYLFANRRANRMKVLVHDGIGIWLCARRLNQGRFLWANASLGTQMAMTREQLDALVLGLPWQRVGAAGVITIDDRAAAQGPGRFRDSQSYLKDVFLRLPTQPHSRIDELLPHRWQHS